MIIFAVFVFGILSFPVEAAPDVTVTETQAYDRIIAQKTKYPKEN